MYIGAYPPEVYKLLQGELPDFAVQSKGRFPKIVGYGVSIFGIFITIIFPLLTGALTESSISAYKEIIAAIQAGLYKDLLSNDLLFALFPLSFMVSGIVVIFIGFYINTLPGKWIAGTQDSLIERSKKNHTIHSWNNVKNIGKIGTAILIELHTGKYHRSSTGTSKYVSDKIYIQGVRSINEIEVYIRDKSTKLDSTGK